MRYWASKVPIESLPLLGQLFSMAARVKNTASADDVKRALLLKVPKLDPAQYMHLWTEKIATSYLEFMLYVLEEGDS